MSKLIVGLIKHLMKSVTKSAAFFAWSLLAIAMICGTIAMIAVFAPYSLVALLGGGGIGAGIKLTGRPKHHNSTH